MKQMLFVFALALSSQLLFSLDVNLSVKECAGVGVTNYPIQTVIPLKKGVFQDLNHFQITDGSGSAIPAQFEVLSRRWMDDKSITNILATYNVSVPAFTTAGTGISTYHFKDGGSGNATGTGLSVSDAAGVITVITGPLKFTVKKNGFNILDEVWFDKDNNGSFAASELVVKSNALSGGQLIARLNNDTTFRQLGPNQFDADRTDLKVEVEKSGPIEAVIRAEAVTKYLSPSDHTHGWAVRIYAYAGKPFIKVDYQLQNSSKLKKYGYPLYFHALNLNLDLNLGNTVTVKTGLGNGTVDSRALGKGLNLMQIRDSACRITDIATGDTLASAWRPEGFMDFDDGSFGVSVQTRNFWTMWPNGIKVDSGKKLSIELFPEWSCQVNAPGKNPVFNATHLYWVQDMQHIYKEVVLNFHGTGETDLNLTNLAKTVEAHPVATMPVSYVAEAASSLDLEGLLPLTQKLSTTDLRTPKPLASTQLGWDYYNLSDNRPRKGTSMVGGAPTGGGEFWVNENPSDWYSLERDLIGELNIRPQWMAQYNHATDFETLHLGTNQQAGGTFISPSFEPGTWRVQDMGNAPTDSALIAQTVSNGNLYGYVQALDNAHCWLYRSQDAYWTIGNPWARDWYKFLGEFRKNFVSQSLSFLGDRDNGHAWANGLQAYKAIGDSSIVNMMVSTLVKTVKKEKRQQYGDRQSTCCGVFGEQAYMVGYWTRQMLTIMDEIKETNPQAWGEIFNLIAGWMDWNYTYSNYGTNVWAPAVGSSATSGQDLVDITSWFVWNTGRSKFKDHMEQFIRYGINGGQRDLGITHQQETLEKFKWSGEYHYRWVQWVFNHPKADSTPAAPVSDLKLSRNGNQCTLTWTAPVDARKYHVIWGGRPIVQQPTDDLKFLNWWASNVVGYKKNASGSNEQVTFTVPDSGYPHLFAAVFSWDSAGNMSNISNLGMQDTSRATAPASLAAAVLSSNSIDLSWGASSDPESGIWNYRVYVNGQKVGETQALSYSLRNLKEMTAYTITVAAVSGSSEEGLSSSATVTTPQDRDAPVVIYSHSISVAPEITLVFSEVLDSVSSVNPENYTLNHGIGVRSASLMADKRTVVLITDSLVPDSAYQLTISGVKDVSSAANVVAPNTAIKIVHRIPLLLTGTKPDNYLWDVCNVNGAAVFIDMQQVLTALPDQYAGLPMLRTGTMQDKSFYLKDELLRFTTNKPLMVYLFLDDRQSKARPTWFTSKFHDNGDDFAVTGATSSFSGSVWEGVFTGDTVILGGLGANIAYANYFVVVRPLDSSWVMEPPVSVEDDTLTEYAEGMGAYPNPFNPQVMIAVQCHITHGNSIVMPKAVLYNVQGKRVASLAPQRVSLASRSGRFEYCWNAAGFASGMYVVSVNAGGKVWRQRLMLAK